MSCSERSFQPDDQSPPKGMADRVQVRSEDSGRRVNELMYSNADLRTTINVVPALASEANLRQVIDTLPTLIWCTRPDGSTEFLNKRWHDYTGCSPEESRVHGWRPTVHPEDLPRVVAKGQELLASGQPGGVEARIRRHDGVFRWFLMRVEPLRDETGKIVRWYGTQTDIEALKQLEEKLREEDRELRRITDAIPQTIVVLDPSGVPVYANQAMLDYTGLSAEDVLTSG